MFTLGYEDVTIHKQVQDLGINVCKDCELNIHIDPINVRI